jgi:membrane protein required for colicin V production
MTWVDLAVGGVLLLSALLAALRGFVREVLGLAAWIGAGFVALRVGPMLEPFFAGYVEEPPIVQGLGLLSAFVVALAVFSLVAIFVARVVRGPVLGGINRTLGLVYGLVRGAALVVAAYILVGLAIHVDRWPPAVLQSSSMGLAYDGATLVVGMLPDRFRPQLQAPPSVNPTAADSASGGVVSTARASSGTSAPAGAGTAAHQ